MGWIEKIYWGFAIVGAALFLVRLVLSLLGAGDSPDDLPVDLAHDGVDLMGDGGSDFTFKLVSLQGLTGFLTMFGLVGLMLLKAGVHDLWTIAGGFAAGMVMLFLISLIFSQAGRLESEGTLDLQNAVGISGSVYLRIREDGVGQVQIPVQGSLRLLDAVTESGEALASGTRVKVVGVKDLKTVVVTKL